MRVLVSATGAFVALFLSGCMAVVVEERPLPPPTLQLCYAADASWAIGERATLDVIDDAMLDAGARAVRVIRPGEFYTEDFRRDRLNIFVNYRTRIVDLSCG